MSARSDGDCCRSSSAISAAPTWSQNRAGSARPGDGVRDRHRRPGVGSGEARVITFLRVGSRPSPGAGDPRPGGSSEWGNPAVRWIDNERRPLLPIDDGEGRTWIEPTRVVPTDITGGAERSIATFRRGGPIALDRLIPPLPRLGRCLFPPGRFLFCEDQAWQPAGRSIGVKVARS